MDRPDPPPPAAKPPRQSDRTRVVASPPASALYDARQGRFQYPTPSLFEATSESGDFYSEGTRSSSSSSLGKEDDDAVIGGDYGEVLGIKCQEDESSYRVEVKERGLVLSPYGSEPWGANGLNAEGGGNGEGVRDGDDGTKTRLFGIVSPTRSFFGGDPVTRPLAIEESK